MSIPKLRARFLISPHNPNVKRWMSLIEARGIKRHQQCLVSGEKLVHEMVIRHPSKCLECLHPTQEISQANLPTHLLHYSLPQPLFKQIDIVGTGYPLVVCKIPELKPIDLSKPPNRLEVLCPLGDPSNIGALIRSCRAFGVGKLILLQEAAHPFHPKAIRAAGGTVFDQAMFQGPAMADLTKKPLAQWIIALDMHGTDLSQWSWPKHARILIGEEGKGLPSSRFPHRLTIPHSKEANSLNTTVAASIALFSYRLSFPLHSDSA